MRTGPGPAYPVPLPAGSLPARARRPVRALSRAPGVNDSRNEPRAELQLCGSSLAGGCHLAGPDVREAEGSSCRVAPVQAEPPIALGLLRVPPAAAQRLRFF